MPAITLDRRTIGTLEVSLTGLGCNNFGWRIDATESARVVKAALDSGINFFDTADIYDSGRSEEFLSRALAGRRHEAIIATKFGAKFDERRYGASRKYIRQAAEDSLRRLGTDYIDLYQIHEPDPNIHIDETLEALSELVGEGKVREIGCSNFSAEHIREAQRPPGDPSRAQLVSVQNEYSLLHREPEAEVLPECRRFGLAFLPYYPLASGLLTGKYRRSQPLPKGSRGETGFGPNFFTEENVDKVECLIQFADERGHSLLDLAFSWLAAQAGVASIIAGAVSPDQVRANAVAPLWKLDLDDIRKINALLVPRRSELEQLDA
ncbi:MAG: aldo/keto reductase [Bryobacteraceae bacterium]|nr:aldo/keto reductase [Solibacteraceae bacterium]MCO5352605.1 aldo/keto reductase [Bryobacteraceae bacterium]